MTYALAKFEVAKSNSLGGDAITMYKQVQSLTFDRSMSYECSPVPSTLHHVIYAPVKFEVATSNGLGVAYT